MGWNTHASGTNDPPEVRNWKIHLIALVASMSALASTFPCPCSPSLEYTLTPPVGYDTAVIGGTILSRYLSEKVIGYLGGSLFLAFAASILLSIASGGAFGG